ncbi:hypothetical protein BH10PSE1_BH10PSE1_13870 [soil metagenome]
MIEPSSPTTLKGIKDLAKTLKKAQGLQHARALDQAAVRAGYQNFKHARNRLGDRTPAPAPQASFPTWVTVAWRDPSGQGGRETCLVVLTRPISELVTARQLTASHNLGGLIMAASDHLVGGQRASSQTGAQWEAGRAARTLQLMDATGLRPTASRRRIYPQGQYANRAPGSDHGVGWYDPETRTYLYTDEPYNGSVDQVAEERAAWADQFGWKIVKPNWRGMHRPEATELFVMAPKTFDLDGLRRALDRLPVWPNPWPGLSRPFGDSFRTPAEAARGR